MPDAPNCITNLSCNDSASSVEVMLDRTVYHSKPPRGDPAWARISHACANNRERISIEELAYLITCGCTFTPGVFSDGKRSNDKWLQQQVFALDFDHDSRIETFLAACDEWGIHPAFTYPTFNHTEAEHRFRAVFVNDAVVTDNRLRKFIQGMLMLIFTLHGAGKKAKPDTQCMDAARLFCGTNKQIIQQSFDSKINPLDLLDRYLKQKKAKDPYHYADYVKKIACDFGIDYRNRQLGVVFDGYISNSVQKVGENDVLTLLYKVRTSNSPDTSVVLHNDALFVIHWNDNPIVNSVSRSNKSILSINTPKSILAGTESDTSKKPLVRLSESNKKILLERCPLLNDFITGKHHVGYRGRRKLITNLRQRDGGVMWYREGLASRKDYTDDNLIDDAERYHMKPEGCIHCHYSDECDHKKNLLQQIPARRHECRQISDGPKRVPVAETRQRLHEALNDCFQSQQPKIYVIKCDSGVGKTRELLLQALNGVCVAFDTHRLKEEAYRRLQDRAGNVFLWPEPPVLPKSLDLKLKKYYAMGTGGTTQIYREALNHTEVQSDFQWTAQIEQYIEALRQVHIQSKVFTTHEKAYQLQRNPNIHTFVFDEDFVKTLVRIDEVKLCDIKTIRQLIRESAVDGHEIFDSIEVHLKNILRAPSRINHIRHDVQYQPNLLQSLILRAPADFSSPLETLFTCNAFRKDTATDSALERVFCINRQSLEGNKKFIVLSATADEEIYRMLFGDRLEFIDLSGTEIKGKLFNHPKRSYSKQSIYTDSKAFAQAVKDDKARLGFDGIITHKFCAETVNNCLFLKESNREIPVFGTFGGLQGLDSFGGKNIAVYGTPYPPEYVVKLWMQLLGIEVDEDDFEFQERSVKWNEFEIRMPICSSRLDVQRLYVWLAYSEIVQAVGRARLINHDCNVHVFAKIPVSGAALLN